MSLSNQSLLPTSQGQKHPSGCYVVLRGILMKWSPILEMFQALIQDCSLLEMDLFTSPGNTKLPILLSQTKWTAVGGPTTFNMDWNRWYYILSVPTAISQSLGPSVPTSRVIYGVSISCCSVLGGTIMVHSINVVVYCLCCFLGFPASRGPT